MKKVLSIIAALGMVLAATAAMAAVSGSPHHYGGGTSEFGMCEVCHVPHAANSTTNTRLWRADVGLLATDGTWAKSAVGRLCGACHIVGGPVALVQNINGATPTNQDALAYGGGATAAHGRDWTVLATLATGDTQDGLVGKPYIGAANKVEANMLECTSCHNPHMGATDIRPFLRGNTNTGAGTISGFCADCHLNRYNTTVTDPLNMAAASSMHPVNISYDEDALNGGTYFQEPPLVGVTLVKAMNANTNPTWPLTGTKMEGALTAPPGGGWVGGASIGCATCHSVHNAPATTVVGDDDDHLLAVDNTGATAALCQSCHGGPGTAGAVGTVAGDHPINMVPGSVPGPAITRWYMTAAPADTTRVERNNAADNFWPRGSTGNIICTSCHSAHNSKSADYARLTRDSYNAAFTGFCVACHEDPSPVGHHSHQYNWPVNSGLDCGDCHGSGISGGAHNGFDFTVLAVPNNDKSELCLLCHSGADPVVAGRTASTAFGGLGNMPAEHLTHTEGTISHELRTFADDASKSIMVKRTAWLYGKSKYGSTRSTTILITGVGQGYGDPTSGDDPGTDLICESCHSVLYNIGADTGNPANDGTTGYLNNLLLQDYQDDSNAAAANRLVGSGLCMGCHNQRATTYPGGVVNDNAIQDDTVAPAGMHPMTNWSITRAQDSGRPTTTLVTTTALGTYADNTADRPSGAAVGTEGTSYPADNAMDCDSCHRPHLADAASTYTNTVAGGASQPRNVILELAGPGNGNFDNLCIECHSY